LTIQCDSKIMLIEKMKEELSQYYDCDKYQIIRALEIINLIGIGQDIAWRRNGVLIEDVPMDSKLFKYLNQGYIRKNKSQHAKLPVYILDEKGKDVYRKLQTTDHLKSIANIEDFKKEFLEINPKLLSLLNFDKKELDDWHIKQANKIIFSNSKQSHEIKSDFYEKLQVLKDLIEKHGLYIYLTGYNSGGKFDLKNKYIKCEGVYQFVLNYIERIAGQFKHIITELNRKVSYYDKLIESCNINMYHLRNEILTQYQEYFTDYKNLISKLSQEKITSSFDSSETPCFITINEDQFKVKMEKIKQEEIDQVTRPIINNLISIEDRRMDFKNVDYISKQIDILAPEDIQYIKDKIEELGKDVANLRENYFEIKVNTPIQLKELDFQCFECGAIIDFPNDESKFILCKYCGTPHYLIT